MDKKENPLFYMQITVDHMDMTDNLSNEECGVAFRLAFDYFRNRSIDEALNKQPPIVKLVFEQLKTFIDRTRGKYERQCQQNRENGKKGGAPKGNQNARKSKDIRSFEETEEDEEWDEIDYDRSSSTLAHWYYCLADELKKNDMSFSMFFNWEQLCTFFSYLTFVIFFYRPAVEGDLSFASYMGGGIEFFVEKIRELGADGFLEEMRDTYKEDYVEHSMEEGCYCTVEEARESFDIITFAIVSAPFCVFVYYLFVDLCSGIAYNIGVTALLLRFYCSAPPVLSAPEELSFFLAVPLYYFIS